MKTNKKFVIASALLLIQAAGAQAEYTLGNWTLTGRGMIAGQGVGAGGADHALFNKFRDITNGVVGEADLRGERGDYFMGFSAKEIGRKDQQYSLTGGRYNQFDYEFFYNEIINRTDMATSKSALAGAGTAGLTVAPGVNITDNPTGEGFTSFEYLKDRKIFGFRMNLLKDSPFYVGLGYDREGQTGARPLGHALGVSSSGSPALELPEPIDWTTNNVMVNAGYREDAMHVAADFFYSSFANNIPFLLAPPLMYNNNAPATLALIDRIPLVNDNSMWNTNLKASFYKLPLNSTVTAKLAYTSQASRVNTITDGILGNSGTTPPSTTTAVGTQNGVTSDAVFDGKINYKTANLSIASNPTEKLNTRLHYTYLVKHNGSNLITYTVNGLSGTSVAFGYKKHIAGLDTWYRLPMDTKLGLGYEFVQIKRDAVDILKNSDHRAVLSLTNNSLDWMTVTLKGKHLVRLTERNQAAATVRRFDLAGKRASSLGLEIDAEPIQHLDAGVGYEYSYGRYVDNVDVGGRVRDWSHTANATAGYRFHELLHASVYGDMEKTYDEHLLKAADDVQSKEETIYYTAGTAISVPLMGDKADIRLGYQYHKGNGQREFNHTSASGNVEVGAQTIPNIDDYTKHAVSARVGYKVLPNLTAKVGYLFEKVDYSDASFDNYTYLASGAPYANQYSRFAYSGAHSDNTYKAHVGFVGAEYSF